MTHDVHDCLKWGVTSECRQLDVQSARPLAAQSLVAGRSESGAEVIMAAVIVAVAAIRAAAVTLSPRLCTNRSRAVATATRAMASA